MTTVDSYLYDGETVCIGRKGTIDKPMYYNGKIWTVDTLFYTHSFNNLLPKFIYNLFQRVNWKKHNEAGGVPSLSKSTIEQIPLNIPSFTEQQKISDFLSQVDKKIEQLTKKKQLLESYKKSVMQKIFNQEIRFKDDDWNDYPEWVNKELGDIITIMQSGVSRLLNDSDIGLPVIRSTNLVNYNLDISDLKYWYLLDNQGANLENFFLKEGDLLVNFINSLAQIGKVAIYENKLKRNTIFTTNLMRLSFKKTVSYKFIFFFFQTNEYVKYIQSITKPAVNQASFTTKEFKALKTPFPSLQEQTKIANFLTKIDDKINQVSKQLEGTKIYKKGLLQQMFV